MAVASQFPAVALPDPFYVFRALTCLGFFTQWILMMINGSFVAMLVTNWEGVFPTGTPVKTTWTGIWPVDFMLGLLVVFFAAINNIAELPDMGPFLILVDLAFVLAVFSMMTLVEDRRNRKTGPLRCPAFWQILWNWCGVASVLPVYSHLYLVARSKSLPRLPADQAQALPFTALWSITIYLPIIMPSMLGATLSRIHDGVVTWFLAPLALGPFQDLAVFLLSSCGYGGIASPVAVAYWIVGVVSAAIHIGITLWALFFSTGPSWARIYWPNHSAVQPGPTLMSEGAMLFMQYDYIVICLCALGLGAYMIGFEKIVAGQSSTERLRAGRPMLIFMAIIAIAGPGAGLAWLLCIKEKQMDITDAPSKQS